MGVCLHWTSEVHGRSCRRRVWAGDLAVSRCCVQLQSRGGDNFSARRTQTLNSAQKNKEVTATATITRDVACTAAAWDIHGARSLWRVCRASLLSP